MKMGSGATRTISRLRAPRARSAAMRAGVRGPTRPAKSVTRLARNGSAASMASPSESRPCRRASDGSSTPTTAMVAPMPTPDERSSAKFRCSSGRRGRAGADDTRVDSRRGQANETPRSDHGLACEVSCRARLHVQPARTFRGSPQVGRSPDGLVPPSPAHGGSATSNLAPAIVLVRGSRVKNHKLSGGPLLGPTGCVRTCRDVV